jgi:hypothetical protein
MDTNPPIKFAIMLCMCVYSNPPMKYIVKKAI